jgi:hypothetical protein
MSVTREELAAFVDGELSADRHEAVAAVIAANPALAAEVTAHRDLKSKLTMHFAPILDEPVPAQMTAPLQRPAAEIVDFSAALSARDKRRGLPRWTWIAAPALAASLTLALFVQGAGNGSAYASGQLASALDDQLVANQPDRAPTRILLSFQDKAGLYCRAFETNDRSGIACRDSRGWKFRRLEAGDREEGGEYRQAGSSAPALMEAAQAMAAGPALDAAAEQQAARSGWR